MKYNFDRAISRNGTGCLKFDAPYDGRPLGDDALPMWIADMDFACPPPVLEAVRESCKQEIFGYTDLKLMPEYYRAVCDYYRRHFDWYINSRDILITPGIVSGIDYVMQALTRKGDGIIIQRPVYYPFTNLIEKNERRVINNALIFKDGRYEIDFDDLEAKAKSKNTTMLILCSPHNPAGRVWTIEELSRIHAICSANGVFIISDEIHCDLTRNAKKHHMLAALFPNDKTIITCVAPSKTFNIAGLSRSHVVIRDEELRAKVAPYTSTHTSPSTAAAVVAAMNECDDWLSQLKDYLDESFLYLKQSLKQSLPKAHIVDAEAMFLAWIDVSAYTKDTPALERALVKQQGVYVEAGDIFGKEGAGFLRVNFGCPRRLLRRFVQALANELDRLVKGDTFIEFALPSAWGGKLPVLADGKKKVVVFLRYVGCPFTQLYVARLSAAYDRFKQAGVKLIVVTQNSTVALEARLNRKVVPFYLCSDTEGEVFAKYKVKCAPDEGRLVSEADVDSLKLIRESKIKEGSAEGEKLVLPAVFVVNPFDKIEFAHYARSVGDMPSPARILSMFELGGN